MKQLINKMMLLWAVNDVLRRPGRAFLTATALGLLTLVASTGLLLSQALSDTSQRLLAQSPAMVVRRLNAGGWMPIPAEQAIGMAQEVPGVLNPRVRIWGSVAGPKGPLTLLAVDEMIQQFLLENRVPVPRTGQAVVGSGVRQMMTPNSHIIPLGAGQNFPLTVIATLPVKTDMATHELILTTPKDARQILNIPQGMASDLVLDLFHSNEAGPLRPELAHAFPWPVHITLRSEARKQLSGAFANHGSVLLILLVPSILALILLVLAAGYDFLSRPWEAGLLRAMGWTIRDLAGLQFWRSALICLPGVTAGQVLAYLAVFSPANRWAGRLFLGWSQTTPALYLSAIGAGLILIEVFCLIVLPYLLASMWPVLVLTVYDPKSLLKGETYR